MTEKYRQRFRMHMRLAKGGDWYVFDILDGQKIVGTKSARCCEARGQKEKITYTCGNDVFDCPRAFIAAYEASLQGAAA